MLQKAGWNWGFIVLVSASATSMSWFIYVMYKFFLLALTAEGWD